ncbi:MAG: hypothetical protein M1358_16050 [Chloroflexi bacterium]|nr:hypothetical protein [Chloroflexota bacterium]
MSSDVRLTPGQKDLFLELAEAFQRAPEEHKEKFGAQPMDDGVGIWHKGFQVTKGPETKRITSNPDDLKRLAQVGLIHYVDRKNGLFVITDLGWGYYEYSKNAS